MEKLNPLTTDEIDLIKTRACSAIVQSVEFPQIFSGLHSVYGGNGGIPRAFIEQFVQKFFQDPIFVSICAGTEAALELALGEVRNMTRVACFRGQNPSSHAWGIYGANGRGICYEVEDRYLYRFFSLYTPKEIVYVEAKPELTTFDIAVIFIFLQLSANWTLSDASFMSSDHPYFLSFSKFAFTKQNDWAGETEVRLVNTRKKVGGYVRSPGLNLKRIILGPECGEVEIAQLRSILNEKEVEVPLAIAKRQKGYELQIVAP